MNCTLNPISQQILACVICALILGPSGLMGILFAFLLCSYLNTTAVEDNQRPVEDLEENRQELHLELHRLKSAQRSNLQSRMELLSYRELLTNGSTDQKLTLISLLSRHPSPKNIQLLKKSVYDPDETIRVMASTVLQKLEDEFVNKIVVLSRDNSLPEAVRMDGLAIEYEAYSDSGLADLLLAKDYMEKAVTLRKQIQKINPSAKNQFQLFRLHLKVRQYELAAPLLSSFDSLHDPETTLWRLRYYFETNRIAALKSALKSLNEECRNHKEIQSLIQFWFTDCEEN
jgi:hypothetical protein